MSGNAWIHFHTSPDNIFISKHIVQCVIFYMLVIHFGSHFHLKNIPFQMV